MVRVYTSVLISLIAPLVTLASDWPMFRNDAERSGYTSEPISTGLSLLWTYQALHAPQPAWNGPDTRMTFDYAYQPVVVQGKVFWASSADCKVYALDAMTGEEIWTFVTGAPVRFAPAAWDSMLFIASDDGWFYALSQENGAVVWQKRGSPDGRMILGNDRMISRWPARGGPVVHDGVLYIAAGIWPSEGIYVYALDPITGNTLWCNEESGGIEMNQPHAGAVAKSGISAQGYLVVSGERLLVPTGRAVPAGLKLDHGALDYFYLSENQKNGGGDVIAFNRVVSNDGQLFFSRNGKSAYNDGGTCYAGFPEGYVYTAPGTIRSSTFELSERTSGTGVTLYRLYRKTQWSASCENDVVSLIVADRTILAGREGEIVFYDLQSGTVLDRLEIDGIPYGMAVANGSLYISTDFGQLSCFSIPSGRLPIEIRPQPVVEVTDPGSIYAQAADAIVAKTKVTEGFCLDLGCGDGSLAFELVKRTQLMVYAVDDDPMNVALARQRLDAAGLYGVRVTVHLADLNCTLYPDYFADLIVSQDSLHQGAKSISSNEIQRLLRPCGGKTCLGNPSEMVVSTRGALEGEGEWTHQYGNPSNTTCSNDTIAKGPLGMLWFRDADFIMPQRHGRGPAPLYQHGRLFVEGLNGVRAVNAYNGRTLWEYPLYGILKAYDQDHIMGTAGTHSNYCVSNENLFIHTKEKCLRLDAATGEKSGEYSPPNNPDGSPGVWGYIACAGQTLFGTLANDDHIVKWRWQAADMSEQFTESNAMFALAVDTGRLNWLYPASDSIRHNAIAIGGGKVFLIDRPVADEDRLAKMKRRGKADVQPLGRLVALDAGTGEVKWEINEGIYGTLLEYSEEYDLLMMSYQPSRYMLPSEIGSWMTVFRGSTGEIVWQNDSPLNYTNRPTLADRTIYCEPIAVDLVSGDLLPFQFARSYGCGTICGSLNLLLFRSATIGYRDLTVSGSVTENYGGCRPACWINTIAAGGLVLMPHAVSGCTCSYLMHASVALQEDKGPREPVAVHSYLRY